MDKQLNVGHGIVIQNLPENMKWDAVKSLEQTFVILPSSVLSVTISKFGVNIIFERYAEFFKAITKRILVINSAEYHIYPMVTDMTVIGAVPFIDERTLKCLMSNIAPVLSVYREKDLKGGRTNNYRVIMNHPEIYDFIKLWPMDSFQIPGINAFSFPITFFCRLCRQNGHTRRQCNKVQQKSQQQQNTDRKRNGILESMEEILRVPYHCDESIQSKQKDKSEIKVSQPTLFEIKDKKSEANYLQLKDEDTDQSNRPEENRCSNNSTFTIQTNIKIPPQRNKSDLPSSKVSKTLHTNVNSPKNVSPSCKKSKKHQKVRFSKLIPPELHIIVSPLKELILKFVNEVCSKTIYTKAKLYQYGVTALLHHLNSVVQFNLKVISTRTSQERRFIFWIDSMLTKIKEEHSKIKNHIKNPKNEKMDQATEMNVQNADSNPTYSPKTEEKKKLYTKYSQGLLSAIRCSKGILKPSELTMFLIHVKCKTHVRQMAKNYSLEVNKVVEQLEGIVSKHYGGFRVIAPTSKEIAWIKELIERLKAHENCKTCQR